MTFSSPEIHHDHNSNIAPFETFPFSLSVSESLVPSRPAKAAGTTTLSLDNLLDPPLRLHEDLSAGCGGQRWPAGLVLAKYLLRNEELVQGKSV